IAERRRFRAIQAVLLENLARSLPYDAGAPYIEQWLRLSPFDRNAHELLLTTLARHGRIAEGEAHLASASKLFEADCLESAPLRELWRQARERHTLEVAQAAPGPTQIINASFTEVRRLAPE